jgi:hypothetical protein
MSNLKRPPGFWAYPAIKSSNRYHFFYNKRLVSACGKWRTLECVLPNAETRAAVSHVDCIKCVAVFAELLKELNP